MDTEKTHWNLAAPAIKLQPVSVTRRMAASLPGLRKIAEKKGLKIHHLGAGYPHPEVTNPSGFIRHRDAWYQHLEQLEGVNDPTGVPEYLRESWSYTDTLGPVSPRNSFAAVYGHDWHVAIDPQRLIPTIGATGGINLACAVFERPGIPLAYITDAPTYAGFPARAMLCQHAQIFSVELDLEGPRPDRLVEQVKAARDQGSMVPFYYTVPDGHNPGGFSFSLRRREEIVSIAKELEFLILEDAPYLYINYAEPENRPAPFISIAPDQTIHLFTGSKIGLPGPRIGFSYSEAVLNIDGGRTVDLTELLLAEASADMLLHNPEALRGFEALLHDDEMMLRNSLWPVADSKIRVYKQNRDVMLKILDECLGAWPEYFAWTRPQAGFFTVFTFLNTSVHTDEDFINRLVADYGVVVIPMAEFYPEDARRRNPLAGLNQVRLSFCFNESIGQARIDDLSQAVTTFCHAVRIESGLPGIFEEITRSD